MKKALPALCSVLCAALVLGAILQAGAAAFLRRQLARQFPGAAVSVARCSLWPLSQVTVRSVDIRKAGAYHVSIGRARLRYSVLFLREPLIPRIQLDDVLCEIDAGRSRAADLFPYLSRTSGGSVVSVGRVIFERCRVFIATADLRCDAFVSGVYDQGQRQLERADIALSSLTYGSFQVNDVHCVIDRSRPSGFYAGSVAFDKLLARSLCAGINFEADALRFSDGTAEFLGGTVAFRAKMMTQSPWEYQAAAQLKRLDLAVLVNEFKWGEKLQASGSLEGVLQVNARPGSIGMLSGSLQVAQSGGRLSILDRKFLDYIARGSGQPVELLAESLRDYRYESGSVTVSSTDEAVVLRAALSGTQGKRDLTVVIHREN
jgi:hypothetical protein